MNPAADPCPPETPFAVQWGADGLDASAGPAPAWLWHGYLAPGALTLLTSPWKLGKTSLLAALLARLRTGGTFAGQPLAPGRAVVVSEESPALWRDRARRLAIGDHVGFVCRPFHARPRPAQWVALLDHLAAVHARHHLALAVIDPLASFFPSRSENDAGSMLDALLPLARLTAAGLAVLVLHHPSKADRPPGHAARGSGALPGYADVLIEMRRYPGAPDGDRRRRLHAFARFGETPPTLVIERTPDGTDYLSLGSFEDEQFGAHWARVEAILADAPHKLTRKDIRARWPPGRPPDPSSLFRWLDHALADGLLRRDGQGRRGSPFRYWLPAREDAWRQDPMTRLTMPELYFSAEC